MPVGIAKLKLPLKPDVPTGAARAGVEGRSEHLLPGETGPALPPVTAGRAAGSAGAALGHALMINDPKSLLATLLLTLLHSLITNLP